MTAGVEKRLHHRFLARLDVRVLSGERLPPDLKLATVDVAVGGARCIASARMEAGARFQISLILVGGELHEPVPVTIDAQVLRCVGRPEPSHGFPFELAIQFTRLEPREKRSLQTYLNSL